MLDWSAASFAPPLGLRRRSPGGRSRTATSRRSRGAPRWCPSRDNERGIARLKHSPGGREIRPVAVPHRRGEPRDLLAVARLGASVAGDHERPVLEEVGQCLAVADHERVLEQRLELLRRAPSWSHRGASYDALDRLSIPQRWYSPDAPHRRSIGAWAGTPRSGRRIGSRSFPAEASNSRPSARVERGDQRRGPPLHVALLVHLRPGLAAGDEPLPGRARRDPVRVAPQEYYEDDFHSMAGVARSERGLSTLHRRRTRAKPQPTLAREYGDGRRSGAARGAAHGDR